MPGKGDWHVAEAGPWKGYLRMRGWKKLAAELVPDSPLAAWLRLASCPRCAVIVPADGPYGDLTLDHEWWHAITDHPVPDALAADARNSYMATRAQLERHPGSTTAELVKCYGTVLKAVRDNLRAAWEAGHVVRVRSGSRTVWRPAGPPVRWYPWMTEPPWRFDCPLEPEPAARGNPSL